MSAVESATDALVEVFEEFMTEYKSAHYLANHEVHLTRAAANRSENKERNAAYQVWYRSKHVESTRAQKAAYYVKNGVSVRARMIANRAGRTDDQKEKEKAYQAAYQLRNREAIRAQKKKYHAEKRDLLT